MTLTKTLWRGVTVDTRTAKMLEEVAWLTPALPQLRPTQGSFNRGGVAQSAGTHDGAGAVDLDTGNLNEDQKQEYVFQLRRVGFAAWIRRTWQGSWGEHIHAISVSEPDASAGAKAQVRDYLAGLNGLASRKGDDGPRDFVGRTWESYLASLPKHVDVTKKDVAVMAGDVFLMQGEGESTAVFLVAADCTRKVGVPSLEVLKDFGYIIESGGGKVLNPPAGSGAYPFDKYSVWPVRKATLDAIPG